MTTAEDPTAPHLHSRSRRRWWRAGWSIAAVVALSVTHLVAAGPVVAGGAPSAGPMVAPTEEGGNPGNLALAASVVTDGVYGYYAVNNSEEPPALVKVRLADVARIGSVTLPGADQWGPAAITDGTYGYFGLAGRPALLKVRLADLEVVDTLELSTGEGRRGVTSAFIDGGHGYFGVGAWCLGSTPCPAAPADVVKVELADLRVVGALTASVSSSSITAASDGEFGYFVHDGTSQEDSRWMVKVRLSDMIEEDAVSLGPDLDHQWPVFAFVIDGPHGFLGTNGRVVRVQLSDLTVVDELTIAGESRSFVSATVDATYVYFGAFLPFEVVRVRLSDLTEAGRIAFDGGGLAPFPVVSTGTHAYFGFDPVQSRSTRVALVPPVELSCGFIDGAAIPSFAREGSCLLRAKGITTSNPFVPRGSVTRSQLAAFLWRVAGEPPAPSSCGFTDGASIPSSARQGACWMKSMGITNNRAFAPGGLVTRSQMATFLWRAAGRPPAPSSCGFTDGPTIPSYARQGACWMRAEGITTNPGFAPGGVVTRSQMAAFLHRLATAD